jgi:uncharacterized protein involved in exopolysaccharide biosynthesis
LDTPLSPTGAAPRTKVEIARQARIREWESTAERLNKVIAANEAEQERLRSNVAAYQARLEAAPTRETELIQLTRDYDTLRRTYTSLLGKSCRRTSRRGR